MPSLYGRLDRDTVVVNMDANGRPVPPAPCYARRRMTVLGTCLDAVLGPAYTDELIAWAHAYTVQNAQRTNTGVIDGQNRQATSGALDARPVPPPAVNRGRPAKRLVSCPFCMADARTHEQQERALVKISANTIKATCKAGHTIIITGGRSHCTTTPPE